MNAGLGHLLHGSGLRNVVPAHRSAQYRLYSALAYYNTGKYRCMSVDLVALLVPLVCDRVFRIFVVSGQKIAGVHCLGMHCHHGSQLHPRFPVGLARESFLVFLSALSVGACANVRACVARSAAERGSANTGYMFGYHFACMRGDLAIR